MSSLWGRRGFEVLRAEQLNGWQGIQVLRAEQLVVGGEGGDLRYKGLGSLTGRQGVKVLGAEQLAGKEGHPGTKGLSSCGEGGEGGDLR